jgi:hypothetical protein
MGAKSVDPFTWYKQAFGAKMSPYPNHPHDGSAKEVFGHEQKDFRSAQSSLPFIGSFFIVPMLQYTHVFMVI